ncbi:MAG: Sterol-binding domain protein, partial [Solirubrobacterales bacterium]|nr:Sterol-binding domain protein [Solirubrobacterales bacterium]
YGFELEDIFAFGLRSVRTKWRATGYPMEEMPGVLPVDPELQPEEVARRQIALMKAGVMGEPDGRPDSSAEIQRLYFDIVCRVARAEAIDGGPMTIQWRFEDADPWHLRIDHGATAAAPGLAPDADVTVETSWRDWIGVSIKGEDPRRALLRRRIRPRGSLRDLLRMRRVFPPRPTRLG